MQTSSCHLCVYLLFQKSFFSSMFTVRCLTSAVTQWTIKINNNLIRNYDESPFRVPLILKDQKPCQGMTCIPKVETVARVSIWSKLGVCGGRSIHLQAHQLPHFPVPSISAHLYKRSTGRVAGLSWRSLLSRIQVLLSLTHSLRKPRQLKTREEGGFSMIPETRGQKNCSRVISKSFLGQWESPSLSKPCPNIR